MKNKLGQIWKKVKVVAIPAGTVAFTLASNGAFGPKGLAASVLISSVVALFTRRPQDAHPSDPEQAQ